MLLPCVWGGLQHNVQGLHSFFKLTSLPLKLFACEVSFFLPFLTAMQLMIHFTPSSHAQVSFSVCCALTCSSCTHSCQSSQKGRDSPRILGLVPVGANYVHCPKYTVATLTLALTNLYPRNAITFKPSIQRTR